MTLNQILETCLYASDLEAAEHFYTAVLGLEVYSRQSGRHVFFRCGQAMFLVFNPAQTEIEQTRLVNGSRIPSHGSRGAGHAAFAIPLAEVDAWRERLQDYGVAIESEVRWPNGGYSLYFRDPAGNSVELATPSMWGLVDT
jgi:catechol 2,3-dioxygenase-like lactoylglutathione lyase family enzyme